MEGTVRADVDKDLVVGMVPGDGEDPVVVGVQLAVEAV